VKANSYLTGSIGRKQSEPLAPSKQFNLAIWTAFLLTIEMITFAFASDWVIYQEQLEAFREIKGQPD